MTLYNLKSADGNWRVTKFTNDLEVESSYITSLSECECPAGSRPTCRHRQMLPKMLAVGAEDSSLFYDFERDQFFEPLESEANQSPSGTTSGTVLESTFPVPLADEVAEPVQLHATDADHTPHAFKPSTQHEGTCQYCGNGPEYGIHTVETPPACGTPHPSIGHIKRRI